MSAIFGIAGAVEGADLQLMARRLTHRGAVTNTVTRPDARGGTIGTRTGIACSDDGRWVAFADASIFNHEELRAKLAHGAVGRDASPAEIILALYRSLGPTGIEAIDGDFAAVLVDRESRSTVLCRDYFGCRPLHYTALPAGGVAFGSEYKALLALPMVKSQPDLDMVQYLQHAKRLPPGRTLLAGIHAALPGAVTTIDDRGRENASYRFAPLRADVTVFSEGEAIELVLTTLRDAIVRRTRDLDRIGLALSGGIDSIGMAFLMRELVPDKPLFTFTAGSDLDDPEIRTAGEAARILGSTHEHVITPPSLLRDALPALVWHLEDPLARTEALQLWKVAQAAAAKVDVLFSGQGADGVFAGMPRHLLLALMKRLPPLRQGLGEFYTFTQLGLPARSLSGRLITWAKFRGAVPPVPRVHGAATPAAIEFPPVGDQFINTVMCGGFQAGVCQDIPKFERTFAASGLLYRPPFYDLRFVRNAFTIADDLKVRGLSQKYIFRRALQSVVPSQFQRLKKFPQRMNVDTEFSDAMTALLTRTLTSDAVTARGFFSDAEIRQLSAARRNGRYHPEAAARLWTLVMTELWAQRFVDERGEPPAAAAPVMATPPLR